MPPEVTLFRRINWRKAIHAADVANRLAEALDRFLNSVARNLGSSGGSWTGGPGPSSQGLDQPAS